jgi:hypothetical protein
MAVAEVAPDRKLSADQRLDSAYDDEYSSPVFAIGLLCRKENEVSGLTEEQRRNVHGFPRLIDEGFTAETCGRGCLLRVGPDPAGTPL